MQELAKRLIEGECNSKRLAEILTSSVCTPSEAIVIARLVEGRTVGAAYDYELKVLAGN